MPRIRHPPSGSGFGPWQALGLDGRHDGELACDGRQLVLPFGRDVHLPARDAEVDFHLFDTCSTVIGVARNLRRLGRPGGRRRESLPGDLRASDHRRRRWLRRRLGESTLELAQTGFYLDCCDDERKMPIYQKARAPLAREGGGAWRLWALGRRSGRSSWHG